MDPQSIQDIKTPQVFEQVFNTWYKPLCKTAFRYTRDEESAEDIVQDVFVKLWQQRTLLTIRYSIKAYLYRAVINASINYNQRQAKSNSLTTEESDALPGSYTSVEEHMNYQDALIEINQALELLPPACKQVFMLSRFEHMSNKEIAEVLEISVKTVENQMTKALKILHNQLSILLKNLHSLVLL